MDYAVAAGIESGNALTFRLKMVKSTEKYRLNCSLGVVMALQPNDAAAWLTIFRQQLDEMFSLLSAMGPKQGGYYEFLPQVDIYETADFYVMEIDLPGFDESDFSVSVVEKNVRIAGVKPQDKPQSCMTYFCLERHFGRFCRILAIPSGFDLMALCKKYERGVLTVTFPRIKGAKDGY